MSPSDRFAKELEQFRINANAAAQFLYAWLSIHKIAGQDADVLRKINEHAFFWNTVLGALQTSLFISLGRIFDSGSQSRSIGSLIQVAAQNPKIFSRAELAKRKANESPGAPWIRQYVRNAYIPTGHDFARIERYAKHREKVYRTSYATIRHKVFAHSGKMSKRKSAKLFSQTNVRELQRLVLSLGELYESLWQLYVNGRKPIFRRPVCSVESIRKVATRADGHVLPAHEKIVKEVFEVLEGLAD